MLFLNIHLPFCLYPFFFVITCGTFFLYLWEINYEIQFIEISEGIFGDTARL